MRKYYLEKIKGKKRYNNKSFRLDNKAKAKKEKRPCQAQLKNCHGYIDNANMFFCSACHPHVEDQEYIQALEKKWIEEN